MPGNCPAARQENPAPLPAPVVKILDDLGKEIASLYRQRRKIVSQQAGVLRGLEAFNETDSMLDPTRTTLRLLRATDDMQFSSRREKDLNIAIAELFNDTRQQITAVFRMEGESKYGLEGVPELSASLKAHAELALVEASLRRMAASALVGCGRINGAELERLRTLSASILGPEHELVRAIAEPLDV